MPLRELVCIRCPRGCHLTVDEETLEVNGNFCPRGKDYGMKEVSAPERILTSTVALSGAFLPLCPVKTSAPIPKGKLFEGMAAISRIKVEAPVKAGDVLVKDFLDLEGVDLVATRSFKKEENGPWTR